MERVLRFYYKANDAIATHTSNPRGTFRLKAVGYPNLAASISNQCATDTFQLTRDGDAQTIVLNRGLYNNLTLISEINAKIAAAYPAVSEPLVAVSVGDSYIQWNNADIFDYTIDYIDNFNRIIVSGLDQEVVSADTRSAIYVSNPSFGLKNMTAVIRNGPRITLPASNDYLDNGLYVLPVLETIEVFNPFEAHLEAEFMSSKNTYVLTCPKDDGLYFVVVEQ